MMTQNENAALAGAARNRGTSNDSYDTTRSHPVHLAGLQGGAGVTNLRPRNLEAEQTVLSALVLTGEDGTPLVSDKEFAEVDRLLNRGADFDVVEHREVFVAMRELRAAGVPLDTVTLRDRFPNDSNVRQTIYALGTGIPSIGRVVHYAKLVREAAIRRAEIAAGLRIAHAAGNADVAEVERQKQILTSLREEKRESEKQNGWRFMGVREVLNAPEESVSWLLPGVLPLAGTSIVAARPKVGKSWLARQLIFCVATGREFLGRTPAQGSVVYLALEEKPAAVAAHFRQMGATGEEPIRIHCGAAPLEGDPGDLLMELANEFRPVLIVIDPLQRLVRFRDSNDYAQVSIAMEAITEVARQSGAHVLTVHHVIKNDNGEEQSILGSTALFGAVDTALIMRRRNNVRSLKSIQRYGADMEEIALQLDPVTGLTTACGSVATLQLDDSITEILQAITEHEVLTEQEIRDRIGGDRVRISGALREAWKRGQLQRDGKGVRNSPFVYSKRLPDAGGSAVPLLL